jgi:biopolymer transport protein TolQ
MVYMSLQDQVLDLSFYQLLAQASIPAKLVLLILLLFSLASWAIIYSKLRSLKRAEGQSREFLTASRRCARWSDILPLCEQFKYSPLARLFQAAYDQVAYPVNNGEEQQGVVGPHPSMVVERALKRAAIAELEQLERGLPWLASIATSAPFIGLFGTVVGIIISFQGLSVQTQTSIQAVAPGIAEALIATAVGLFVAVPAYIAYNHFVAQVRRITGLLDDFCLEILNAIDRSTTQYGVFRS